MPFESEKQRRWMHANEPEMAKRWEKKEEALKQEGGGPTAATIRMPAEKITSTVSGTPDWEQAFLEYESAEQDTRRFPDPGLLQRLEDVVGEDWREDYDEWKEHPHRAEPLKPSQPGPLISEEDSGMKIKGLELKQMVKEALLSEMGCGGGHHGHEQPSMGGMNDLLALGGGQSQAPLIIIQTSEEEQEGPAVTHPTHIRHKQQAPEVSGLEQLIPMLLQLEGQVVSFSSRELESHVKRSLKRVLRENRRK